MQDDMRSFESAFLRLLWLFNLEVRVPGGGDLFFCACAAIALLLVTKCPFCSLGPNRPFVDFLLTSCSCFKRLQHVSASVDLAGTDVVEVAAIF